jgi:hypothetical protein
VNRHLTSRQEEKFAYRSSLSKIASLTGKKNPGHTKVCCTPKEKNGHHQDVEYEHPTNANSVIPHYAAFATSQNTMEKGMLKFKIKAYYEIISFACHKFTAKNSA